MPLEEVAPSGEALRAWMARFPQDLQPFVDGTNVFDGKLYSWPIGSEGGRMMLFWNTKLFREAALKGPGGEPGVPETWDDMRRFAKKITELGQGKIYGIVHGIKDPGVWVQDINMSLATAAGWTYGAYNVFMSGGRANWHHPGYRGALQLWLDMKKDGSVFPGDLSMDDEQAKFKFAEDLAGMIFGGPWVPGGLLAVNESLEFDTMLPPTQKKGERKGAIAIGPVAATSEYVVSSRTKNRGAVWKIIEFMTSARYQEGWVKAGGGYSVFPEYNRTEFFPHPTIAKIARMGAEGRRVFPPITDTMSSVFELMEPVVPNEFDTVQAIWIGRLGMAEALDDLERRTNASLDKALEEARKRGIDIRREDFSIEGWDPSKNHVPPKDTKR